MLKLHSLIDKVYSVPDLKRTYKVCALKGSGPGLDNVSWQAYGQDLGANLLSLSYRLKTGSYRVHPYRIITRSDAGGKTRDFHIPTVEDRLVQKRICQVIEPHYERIFFDCSFEYRRHLRPIMAVDLVQKFTRTSRVWVVDADVSSFYQSVNRKLLDSFLAKQIADGKFLRLVQESLGSSSDGLPVGNGLSPLLSNVFLHETDAKLKTLGIYHLRICDRFLLFVHSQAAAITALTDLMSVLATQSLILNQMKTRLWFQPDPIDLVCGTCTNEHRTQIPLVDR